MTDVGICNLALTKIGERIITTLTDSTETARRCNLLYQQTRDTILRSHMWNFATKIEALNVISDEEIINFDYLYLRPSNCLYIMQIFDENKTEINEYELLLTPTTNMQCIASNTPLAYIKYINKETDTSKYDSIFIEALANKLAAELAVCITGKQDLANNFLELYNISINQAKQINMAEQHSKATKTSQFYEVR